VNVPGTSFFIPFEEFDGDQTVFANSGAVVFRILPDSSTGDDVDLTVDLFEATANTDWGDLPENGTDIDGTPRYYTTTEAYDGPRHVYTGSTKIWLGALIDLEADGTVSNNADGDDNDNFNDGDGIVRIPIDEGGAAWDSGTGYISATVTGGTGDLYAWFDWNDDGDFDDTGEALSWTGLSAGEHKLSVTVDAGSFVPSGGLYGRFRLVEQGAGDPGYTGSVNNGEVEDYYWPGADWGPNAVTLSAIDAGPALAGWPAFALVIAAVAGGAGLFVWKRRA
jgi:hypothetical protein